jgi:hypothetical protein
MSTFNSFKEFMESTYDQEDLKGIATHGCANYAPHNMIYYTETTKLYHDFSGDLHMLLDEYKENFGEFPQYVIDNLGDDVQYFNSVVWFCAEYLAQQMTYEEEEA